MKAINWTEVEESKPSMVLQPGGYVVKIILAADNDSAERIEVIYDVAEGPNKGCFADLPTDDNWKHQFNVSYKNEGRFKAFLNCLEDANPSFTVANWMKEGCMASAFNGLILGVVLKKQLYTKNNGEDGEKLIYAYSEKVNKIRTGDFKVPEPWDTRETVNEPAASYTSTPFDNEPVPFS